MNTNRRTFLKTSAAVALGFPAILRAANPNSNLQIAAVGCSGKGLSDITEVGSHPRAKYVGLCDVDTSHFDKADAKFPGVAHFQDFREMFAKLGDTFDAAIVSTPDHMHAFIALDAMRRGKHVYCQKPLTHTVWEARQMRLQAAKSRVVTQMGNQIHSHEAYRTAVKLIRDGTIGKVTAVHAWQPNNGNGYTKLTAPPASGPVPDGVDWDRWLGVAPHRDYAPDVYHPFKWRDWQDFGGGTMGDFGCHILDPIFTALGLTAPISIRAENEGLNPHTWPFAETVSYTFPGTAFTAGQTIAVTWYDGGHQPTEAIASILPADKKIPQAGSIVLGQTGAILIPHVAMPEVFMHDTTAPVAIEKVAGSSHYHAWVDAALGGPQTTDGFDYAGPLTEAVQLGNVATRLPGETLLWDAAALKITSHPDANRLLTKTYRDGWKIEAVA